MRRKIHLPLLAATLLFALFMIGCGSDDGSGLVTPDVTGTIVIEPTPDSLNAPWVLFGPDSYTTSGNGDETLLKLNLGEYTLVWGPVYGWTRPSHSTQTLVDDSTVSFSGTYVDFPGLTGDYALIPPASVTLPITFTMGGTAESNETPHEVTLNGRFEMAETEITNGQYVEALQWAYNQGHVTATAESVQDALDGSTSDLLYLGNSGCQISFSDGTFSTPYPERPVVEVSWYGAAAYCDWLSLQESLPRSYDHSTWSCNSDNPYDATGYRLPTEAEWEFACRAGTATPFNTGDCLDADTEANYRGFNPYTDCPMGLYLGRTVDVGSYPANGWGLFEMHGNVVEWCNDWFADYSGDETDPVSAGSGDARVFRGGSWYYFANHCRSAYRFGSSPSYSSDVSGFRPVRSTS
ncbi:MAG: formylglycine-generating enzyme family protein [Gemmatimonadales bacterium]|nr:formylglycine-generating enzyme family protein [Gemmatimonadales bacterium]